MDTYLSKDEQQGAGTAQNAPSVSIILPFKTALSSKRLMEHQLKITIEKASAALLSSYPPDKARLVIEKLEKLAAGIDLESGKKALAIFASPSIEKVFYFDIPVSEKIVVDGSFWIRDLIYNNKTSGQFLVFMLSADSSKIYLGSATKFIRLKPGFPENIHAFERDMPERVGPFSDPSAHKQILIDQFLLHLDRGLSKILHAYPFPVFVMGPEKILGHFKAITKNVQSLAESIHGNYLGTPPYEIRTILKPYMQQWLKIQEKASLLQVQQADDDGKLECGFRQIWRAVDNKNCRKLVIEKDLKYPLHKDAAQVPDGIPSNDLSVGKTDAIDNLLEKVLEAGGDIEFVGEGALREYQHIALIRFY